MDSPVAWLRAKLLPYGPWGILALTGLDASFIPMPQIVDAAVMIACALEPGRAWAYAGAAVAGSTAGTAVLYSLARAGRAATLAGRHLGWVEALIRRHGALAVLVAALMPAPFPFKAVVVSAGYLRQPAPGFLAGVGAGRLLRFGTEALLAATYGRPAIAAVQAHGPVWALAAAALLAGLAVAWWLWRR